jgi:hypothetical protein
MKTKLLAVLLVSVAGIVSAQTETKTYTVPTKKSGHVKQQTEFAPTRATGAIPRAGRNPLQMLNPRAPQRYYGTPQETVVTDTANYEANHHPQVTGLILFGLGW